MPHEQSRAQRSIQRSNQQGQPLGHELEQSLGQHPSPTHLVVHLSDTHFLAAAAPLYGLVDTDKTVVRALLGLPEQIGAAANPPPATIAPVDTVTSVNGLRIIALDTSLPGYHHGELGDDQLDWLAEQLREPSPHGSILALHHPPIASPIGLMTVLELREQHRLAAVVAGSDIRSIVGGHLHYATHGLFAGIPVSVAAATCYTMDLTAPHRDLTGVNGGQSLSLMYVYDGHVVHSQVPIGDFETVSHLGADLLDRIAALSPADRLDVFSRQR